MEIELSDSSQRSIIVRLPHLPLVREKQNQSSQFTRFARAVSPMTLPPTSFGGRRGHTFHYHQLSVKYIKRPLGKLDLCPWSFETELSYQLVPPWEGSTERLPGRKQRGGVLFCPQKSKNVFLYVPNLDWGREPGVEFEPS